jgi:hypothetical protein
VPNQWGSSYSKQIKALPNRLFLRKTVAIFSEPPK